MRSRGKALALPAKREAVERKVSDHHFSEPRAYQLVGISRDSDRHPPQADQAALEPHGTAREDR